MKLEADSYADVLIRVGGENGEDVLQYHLPRSTVLATAVSSWGNVETTFEVKPLGQYAVQVIPGKITLAARALWEDRLARQAEGARRRGGSSRKAVAWADLAPQQRDEYRRRAKLALEAAGEL